MRDWEELEKNLNAVDQERSHYIAFCAELAETMVKKMKEDGITQNELSKRTGLSQPQISRFFNLHPSPNLETVYKMASGLGLDILLMNK